MKPIRIAAFSVLIAVAVISGASGLITPHSPSQQFRTRPSEPPSSSFLLGTDELGRDRFARLARGTQVSLFAALSAAIVATSVATLVGLLAGIFGGLVDGMAQGAVDLFLSLPWLFALLSVRALFPLNARPEESIALTFALLAIVGWAPSARVIRGSVEHLRSSGVVAFAHACGMAKWRILFFHMLPNLRPVVSAQFWVLVPAFIITEANLGALGLGITEPIPSWGNMLAELQNYQRLLEQPWIAAPAVLLVLVVGSLQIVIPRSAQAAGRGSEQKRNSADSAASGESVVREFLKRSLWE
jgi:ABC-type dipeptide/oligopeptide/nickel transport system permease subunit